jgi:hypothetical protein
LKTLGPIGPRAVGERVNTATPLLLVLELKCIEYDYFSLSEINLSLPFNLTSDRSKISEL